MRPPGLRGGDLGLRAVILAAFTAGIWCTMPSVEPDAEAAGAGTTSPAHLAEVQAWRRLREERLRSDEGWLTVAGLYWLEPGTQTFGSARDCALVLPASAPALAGKFLVTGKQVEVEAAPGVTLSLAGESVQRRSLRSDAGGEATPDVLVLGRLRLFVIERSGKLAIRLRDLDSPRRTTFAGLTYFPIQGAYRMTARFVPHPTPTRIKFPTIVGGTDEMVSPGTAVFQLGGRELRLDAALETRNDTRLFFIFRDLTAGKETYGAGRFLYTTLPAPAAGRPSEQHVVLDFNQAYTPPCAFTPFAVCPLPPPQNRLPIRVEAGERFAGHGP